MYSSKVNSKVGKSKLRITIYNGYLFWTLALKHTCPLTFHFKLFRKGREQSTTVCGDTNWKFLSSLYESYNFVWSESLLLGIAIGCAAFLYYQILTIRCDKYFIGGLGLWGPRVSRTMRSKGEDTLETSRGLGARATSSECFSGTCSRVNPINTL